jgi:hypothetical protein
MMLYIGMAVGGSFFYPIPLIPSSNNSFVVKLIFISQ